MHCGYRIVKMTKFCTMMHLQVFPSYIFLLVLTLSHGRPSSSNGKEINTISSVGIGTNHIQTPTGGLRSTSLETGRRKSLNFSIPSHSGLEKWEEENGEDETAKVKLRNNILTELGFEDNFVLPNTKANISREEYLAAYSQYFRNKKERRENARLSQSPRGRRRNDVTRIHEFIDEGTDNGSYLTTFHFTIKRKELRRENIRIQSARIIIPSSCSTPSSLNGTRTWEGWNEYDLTANVISWLHSSQAGPIFQVNATCSSNSSSTDKSSVLRIVGKELSKNRSRRSVPKTTLQSFKIRHKGGIDCAKTRRGKTCCRRSMNIKFSDLGISDLIIEPHEFDAHVCVGRCNAKRVPFSSTHAMFQQILHQTKGKKFTPRPCCTPTKLIELDVIHLDPTGSKLEVTVLKDAIVAECGCS